MHAAYKLDGLKFNIGGEEVTAVVRDYAVKPNGPRIDFYCDDGPYACLTVNPENPILSDDEILVKTHSENARIADALRNTYHFEDTGKRVKTGFVEAQVWRVNGPRCPQCDSEDYIPDEDDEAQACPACRNI